MKIDNTLPLNIYHIHLVAEMHSRMRPENFETFLSKFTALLEDNRPDEAQGLINRMVNEFTGTTVERKETMSPLITAPYIKE